MYPTETSRLTLAAVARALLIGRGDWQSAQVAAEKLRATDPVMRIIREAVGAGELTPANAASLSDLQDASDAFTANLRGISFFDTIRASGVSKILPARRQSPAIIGSATASSTQPGELKNISSLSIGVADLELTNVSSIIWLSNELARTMKLSVLNAEISRAVAASVDGELFQFLLADTGVTTLASAGSPQEDLRQALANLSLNSASKIYAVGDPNVIADIAAFPSDTGGGAFAFPSMSIQGGELQGVQYFPSENLPGDSPKNMLFVDISKLATAADVLLLNATEQAALFEGDGGAADPMLSMWQRNATALRAERFVGWVLAATSGAIVKVEGVEYA